MGRESKWGVWVWFSRSSNTLLLRRTPLLTSSPLALSSSTPSPNLHSASRLPVLLRLAHAQLTTSSSSGTRSARWT